MLSFDAVVCVIAKSFLRHSRICRVEEKRQVHHIGVLYGYIVMRTRSDIHSDGVLIIGHIG